MKTPKLRYLIRTIITPLFGALLAVGCLTSANKLSTLKLDMPQAEVRKTMGEPTAVRTAIRNKHGQTIEVWEYVCDRGSAPDATYWLYFYQGKLVEWNEAGDWRKEAERINERDFSIGSPATTATPK
jgi:hypothetical protein